MTEGTGQAPESNKAESIARQLARAAIVADYRTLPAETIEACKNLILDQLGCQLVGSTMPWVEPALRLVELTRGARPESTVVDAGFRCVAADAAFVNATYGQACELDDATFGSAGHIGTAAIPAALAVGQSRHVSGAALVVAIVVGYETMYRLMATVRPRHRSRGFHSQGIGGPFAAAAATAKLLCLGEEATTNAFGIAGSHSSGPLEYDQAGGEVKRVHAGIAAKAGIESALLADLGLTGPHTIIEGPRGFVSLFGGGETSSILVDLGETWNIGNAWFKIFPAVGGVQTSIAAVQALVQAHTLRAEAVTRVRIGITESQLMHCAAIKRPHDMVSAQFSLAYSVALALSGKSNALGDYLDESNWTDASIDSLSGLVEVYAHPDAVGERDFMSEVEIETIDGRLLRSRETYPIGSPRNPASRQDRLDKFFDLAGAVVTPARAREIARMVENIESVVDVNELAELLNSDKRRSSDRI